MTYALITFFLWFMDMNLEKTVRQKGVVLRYRVTRAQSPDNDYILSPFIKTYVRNRHAMALRYSNLTTVECMRR